MINDGKPATSFSNSSKVSIGETWATITTTWASETRTWLAISQLITNTSRNLIESFFSGFPFLRDFPFLSGGGMTNTAKS
jgi:hypothetical protein